MIRTHSHAVVHLYQCRHKHHVGSTCMTHGASHLHKATGKFCALDDCWRPSTTTKALGRSVCTGQSQCVMLHESACKIIIYMGTCRRFWCNACHHSNWKPSVTDPRAWWHGADWPYHIHPPQDSMAWTGAYNYNAFINGVHNASRCAPRTDRCPCCHSPVVASTNCCPGGWNAQREGHSWDRHNAQN